VAKHEPWFRPRDEDGDDALLDWLGKPDPRYSQRQRDSGGCATGLLIVGGGSVLAWLGVAATVAHILT
jgi:hypothetical protein